MAEGIETTQKAWQFIRALNEDTERLDAIAISDIDRDYTYRQLFRWQDRYAEVFTALGITEANGSRVGVVCSQSVMTVFSFLALNMLGVSMSAITYDDLIVTKWILKAIEVEGITDLVLPDTIVRPDVLHELLLRRPEIGLRNIIVVETSRQTPCPTRNARAMLDRNLQQIRNMPGVRLMGDLLARYAATPIAYGSGVNDEAAAIVHSSGTTKGAHKPIPLSDVALNTAVARLIADEHFSAMSPGTVVLWAVPVAFSTGFVNLMYVSLAFGATLTLFHGIMDTIVPPQDLLKIEEYKINAMFAMYRMFEGMMDNPKSKDLDLSELKLIVFGGAQTSVEQMERVQHFVREHGGDPQIINGYGLSECCAANTLAAFDGNDHGIGRPLQGVTVRICDEETGEFHAIDGTPHVGTLYLSSPSNSCGRLGDEVLFELEEIEGETYVCTNDLVRTNEEGDLFFVGRANRFFVNNDGIRFDASVVETAIASQEGITECVIVGAYEKALTHDTVPVLYVRVAKDRGDGVSTVHQALRAAYLNDETVAQNNLPWMCVIVDELPYTISGKVDVVAIQSQQLQGRAFTLASVVVEDKLVDVKLVPADQHTLGSGELSPMGVPQEMRQDKLDQMVAMGKTLGPDFLRQIMSSGIPAAIVGVGDGPIGAEGMAPGAMAGNVAGAALSQSPLPLVPMLPLPLPLFPFMPLKVCGR